MSRFPSGTRFSVDISPNKTVSNFTPTSITMHWWDDPARRPQFGGVVSWLKNPSARVSAHYVVEANRITQMVLEKDTAWHSGSTQGNQRSVGIEVNPRLSDGDYETTAQLVAEIWSRLGKLPVYPHRHWSSTSCPGTMDLNRVVRRAEQIRSGGNSGSSGGGSKPAAKPAPTPSPSTERPTFMSLNQTIKSLVTGNRVRLGTLLQNAHREAYHARLGVQNIWKASIRSQVSGAITETGNVIGDTQLRARQALAKVNTVDHRINALAKALDELLDGQGKILEAVESIKEEEVEG